MKKLLLLLLVRNLLPPQAKKKERDAQPTIPRSSISLFLSLSLSLSHLSPSLTPQNKRHENTQQPNATRALGAHFQLHQQPSTRAQKDGSWMISEPEPTNQPTNPPPHHEG
jgi:hypothetical protein